MGGAQSKAGAEPKSSVSFRINGTSVTAKNVNPLLTLNEWLRAQPGLTGTKKMCGEGGCGCCVVAATRVNPATQKETTIAINSCLCPLLSVEGWSITTVEGIGSSTTGFHPIQKRIAEYNGSQCGYCTPGFVMSMYSFLEENPKPTKQQVEDNFDGNICRCTGYRPILDAMKSFAVDSDPSKGDCIDIEDVGSQLCPHTGEICSGREVCRSTLSASDPLWYSPSALRDVFEIVSAHPDATVKLVAGNTGRGVFKGPENVDVFIDLKGIAELYTTKVTDSTLIVGGALPLANLIGLLQANQDKSSTFEHLASHLLKVGSWAGNLMLTHDHDNFPSDVFTVMAAAGATLIVASTISSVTLNLWDFISYNMKNSVIVSMTIPYTSSDAVFRSFKVMPRAENAHAYVNAGFYMEVDTANYTVKGKPSLVFGGISTHGISASATGAYLEGKNLLEPNTLNGALESLGNEIVPNTPPAAASAKYRKSLAISLFYKFYLAAIYGHVSARVQSAAVPPVRPVSQGYQSFSSKPSEYPITEPMMKLTAKLQASGEAQYTTDIPTQPAELAAAFVLTTQGNAKILGIDSSQAEQMPGFVRLLTATEIPQKGKNNYTPFPGNEPEPVMVTDFSEYAGQAVAIVLADTQENATLIAQAVTVQQESVGKPILTTQEAIAAGSFFDNPGPADVVKVGDAKAAISSSSHSIQGEIACGTQYHFHMETHTSLCIPEDDGVSLISSTQWTSVAQAAVSNVLGIPTSSVNVSVKRVGGAYGAKITRSHQIAAACGLGAYITKRPVRMHLDIDTNMKMIGKRFPFYATYTVGFTDEGIINGIEVTMYIDCGWSPNDNSYTLAVSNVDNAYHVPNWLITPRGCKTNTASNTACRSPGTLPGIFIMEAMIDHVARFLNMDVGVVKRANLYKQGQVTPTGMVLKYCSISSLWDQLYNSADVASRKGEVETFNKANRWRKRGLTMSPVRFGLAYGSPYTVFVSIYFVDGTVAIAHGGVEIGQGINTKVAQVAAKTLGIPLEMVKVKPSNTLTNPNGETTGGSTTSEMNCLGTLNACTELNNRIQPIREKYPDASWQELMQKCYDEGVDLSAKAFVQEGTESPFVYNSYGVACSEVEVDVLTGQTEVLRVDILYDCGESINPEIDIGQVEGAFMMGLGYWLTEKVIYDPDSGQLLTHNTWEYKPPSSKDIPVDFRVELLKNAPNPVGFLGSKACGEPPLCLSCSVLFAVKRAIENARSEIGKDELFVLSGPATVEDIQQACLVDPSQFYF